MKLSVSLAIAIVLALSPMAPGHARLHDSQEKAADPGSALPSESVYQLPVVLVDQHGQAREWRTRRGRPQLVAMFYANCRYICPLIVEAGKAVERQLAPAERAKLGVLYISLDPERDTPARLAQLGRERRVDDARWTLAAPRASDVRSVAGVLDVRYRRLSDGEFNHTSALILLDADGRIVARTEKVGSQVDPEFVAAVRSALAKGLGTGD